jgi:putative transposase
LVVRNGYHDERTVPTGAGAVAVKAPRVNDKSIDPETGQRQRFCSAILPAWCRRSPQISEVLPLHEWRVSGRAHMGYMGATVMAAAGRPG